MTLIEIQAIVAFCAFRDYTFVVKSKRGAYYLQGHYIEEDIVTKKPEIQYTRKWLISPFMTRSEIVQTVFKCCITSMEHRTRESFSYKKKRIFGPHFDVEALHKICADHQFDYRKEP